MRVILVKLKNFSYMCADRVLNFVNKFERNIKFYLPSEVSTSSDSQSSGFEEKVKEINLENRKTKNFRRNYQYRKILEHVSYSQGLEYLERIYQLGIYSSSEISLLKSNDKFGNPRVFFYPGIGNISPTTLRYASVLSEIQSIFGREISGKFVEIGVGYGGQFSVLSANLHLNSYDMYDLKPVLDLTEKYLSEIGASLDFTKMDINDIKSKPYDLTISNYAFSELPYVVQKEYLEKILKKSKRGYMIMNSGRTNFSGRSTGKMTLKELNREIPTLEVREEYPKTGPDNYVLIWGRN